MVLDLQNELKEAYLRDLGKININPADPSQNIPVGDLQVELDLQIVDDVSIKRIQLDSYEDAFSAREIIDIIVLFASHGCGKSVQCQIIAFKWAKDGILGNKYKLVIFLKLSGVNPFEEVALIMIEQLRPHRKGQQDEITRMLKNNKANILYILDSYDEMLQTDEQRPRTGQYTVTDIFNDKEVNLLSVHGQPS